MSKANFSSLVSVIPFIFTAITFLSIPQVSKGQTVYALSPGQDVNVKVLGSSNVHDWTMISSGIESQGDFKFNAENQLKALSSFSFYVDTKSLKSEHESMDSRAHKALKADQYSKITYKITSSTIVGAQKNKYIIKTTGDLTIAGVTQAIKMNVNVTVNPDNSINCSGSEKMKLTDYKIELPSFMLGTMKVTNDLTIQFNLLYKKKSIVL